MSATTESMIAGQPALRRHFQDALAVLENDVVELGVQVRDALARSVEALVSGDGPGGMAVVAGDDDIDRRYREIEGAVLRLLAQQSPVATDLRFLSAVLHIALHLERVGDSAVNVAVLGALTSHLTPDPAIVDRLREMGHRAAIMVDDAMRAFTTRSADAAADLLADDDAVDYLERQIFQAVLAIGDDHKEWGLRMLQASRHVERAADHAVDIAEEIAFVASGSHPVRGGQPETPPLSAAGA